MITTPSSAELQAIAFVGDALSPLLLEDPVKGSQTTFESFKQLDASAAGAQWPFADPALATECLAIMSKELCSTPAEELAHGFRTMFIGPFKKTCPPWGSVYMDHEGVTFGPTTLALRQWMREVGIERTQEKGMPDDHIGFMLSLMAWVARNKPEALGEYLSQHLLTWAPHFFEEMEKASTQPFYQALARLAGDSLVGIKECLKIQVDTPRFFR